MCRMTRACVACDGVACSVGMVVVWSAVLRGSNGVFFFFFCILVSFSGNQPDSHGNELLPRPPADDDPP